jgi:hypothetical protein
VLVLEPETTTWGMVTTLPHGHELSHARWPEGGRREVGEAAPEVSCAL